MSEIIYVYHNVSFNKNIYKIGSTRNLLNRFLTYKTGYPDLNPDVLTYTFNKVKYSCYDIDKLINESSRRFNNPFKKYNSTGGTEFYVIEDINKLDNFLTNDLQIQFEKKCVNIIDLLAKYHKNIELEESKTNNELIEKTLKQLENKYEIKPIILRPWQNTFKKMFFEFVSGLLISGIIIAPTGCGKSFMMIYVSLMYIKEYKNDVLIMTKKKEIFDGFSEKIQNMMVQLNVKVDIFDCINKKYKKNIFSNKTDINRIILINSDKFIMSNEFGYYEDIDYGKIKLCIQDECHWSGGNKLFKFLKFIKTKVNKLVGFSATPTRVNENNRIQTFTIFGNGKKPNVVYERDYLTAIKNKDILKIGFDRLIVEMSDIEEITHKGKKYYVLTENGMKQLFDYLKNYKSFKHKGIIWFKNIKNAIKFYNYTKTKTSKYKFHITFSNTKNLKNDLSSDSNIEYNRDEIEKFKNDKEYSILLAVFRATEGFDDPTVDFAVRAYFGFNIDPVLELQRMGRVMRTFSGKIDCTYITMEVNTETCDEDTCDRMVNVLKLIKHQHNKHVKNNKDKTTLQELLNMFTFRDSRKTSSDVFMKKLVETYLKNNKSKSKKEFKRYINKLNSITDKYICTVREISKLMSDMGYKFKLPNNVVRFSLGDELFEKFKSKYYDVETVKKIINKFRNIEEFEKNTDIRLPSLELIDSGFYNDEKYMFNLNKYFNCESLD